MKPLYIGIGAALMLCVLSFLWGRSTVNCPVFPDNSEAEIYKESADRWAFKYDSLKAENDRMNAATKPTPTRVKDAIQTLTDKPLVDGFDRAVEIQQSDLQK